MENVILSKRSDAKNLAFAFLLLTTTTNNYAIRGLPIRSLRLDEYRVSLFVQFY